MKIEYPKAIYNNKTRTTITVKSKEEEDPLKNFFSDSYQGGLPEPYAQIDQSEAITIVRDTLKEVQKPVEKPSEIVDIKSMQWAKLKAYAKTLGVKVPLGAKRDQIEDLIQEVLNGNDKRPNKS